MTNIPTPEPVARQVRYFDSNLLSTGYGKWTEWAHFHGRHERAGAYEMRDLITTTQAEAYKDACVREALEEAIAAVESCRTTGTIRYGTVSDCIEAIRALLPSTPAQLAVKQ